MATLAPWRGYVKQNLFRDPAMREALSAERIESYARGAGHAGRRSFGDPGAAGRRHLSGEGKGAGRDPPTSRKSRMSPFPFIRSTAAPC
jgi:hypothetical protein